MELKIIYPCANPIIGDHLLFKVKLQRQHLQRIRFMKAKNPLITPSHQSLFYFLCVDAFTSVFKFTTIL